MTHGQGRPGATLSVWLALWALLGAGPPVTVVEDATLRDVQFAGVQTGLAVGDQGAIWRTADAGLTWKLDHCPVPCTLRSVSLLGDKLGWIAGGYSLPYAHLGVGVVLRTKDGEIWERVGGEELPELHRIKFFTPQHGIAVGEPNTQFPTGVLITEDGGETWRPAPGETAGSWRAADFLHPSSGSLAGLRGERAIFGGGRLVPHALANLGLRGLYGLRFSTGGQGWLVGDGGLVLFTSNGGVGWEPPRKPLPEGTRDLFDFRAVAVRGDQVWIAGDPGSIIWHSPDGGRNWVPQATRQTLPILALSFPSETQGWAVGELGTILRTEDGGRSWLPVRGAGHRLAYLALCARPEGISLNLVASMSAEQGYRGMVQVLPRRDFGPEVEHRRELDLQIAEAVTLAGGNSGQLNWAWPLDIPGLETNEARLIEEWTKRSEGQLGSQLVGRLVRLLRTWRPSVILVENPQDDEALVRLIKNATLIAARQASDPTRFPEQYDRAGLPAWQPDRVFLRLAPSDEGQVQIAPFDLLARNGTNVAALAAPAVARLQTEPAVAARDNYRAIALDGTSIPYSGHDFFAGLPLAPGSDARRALPPVNDEDLAKQQKLAQQQKHYQAYIDKFLHDGRHARQLLAQLGDLTAGLPDDQAAMQLALLADAYRRQGDWELSEGVLVALVEQFPREPAAQHAMRTLFQLWVGVEPTYRRLKGHTATDRKLIQLDGKRLAERMDRANQVLRSDSPIPDDVAVEEQIRLLSNKDEGLTTRRGPVNLKTGLDSSLPDAQHALWQEKAQRMSEMLARSAPAWHATAEMQLSLASLFRQRQRQGEATQIYGRLQASDDSSNGSQIAGAELWLTTQSGVPPRPVYRALHAPAPPQLDGLLNDPCWEQAAEMPLASARSPTGLSEPALLLWSFDEDFLYVGGVCPRHAKGPDAPVDPTGRTHDANLDAYDRVSFLLDLDRDYATSYRFTIDQRGWTAEDCWGDATWNPQWYVANSGDENFWRFEVAIPLDELQPGKLNRGATWAMHAYRIVPAVGAQAWIQPVSALPRMDSAGLLRFE